ncbi:unnamed protein product [Cuscuta campestris]|uniref:Retrovirus-related Pol polyprotein from transposon TNT 1-94-like beta-barrel domain-containing protein n=1 Tax=Cuscuta campestris TaxID=132261 RepID=A0A484M1R4_9ASTE|nr:unnamed protein product [Cuscuta campestris]
MAKDAHTQRWMLTKQARDVLKSSPLRPVHERPDLAGLATLGLLEQAHTAVFKFVDDYLRVSAWNSQAFSSLGEKETMILKLQEKVRAAQENNAHILELTEESSKQQATISRLTAQAIISHAESMYDMQSSVRITPPLDERFHKILNDLASLNRVLSPKEKNVRLLRSLPTEWYTKATAMEEGRNLENYTVQGLLDELRTYEHELMKKKEEQVIPFPTALITTPRVPPSEGTCPRNCDTPSSSQPSSSRMENYDEEFAMMVKQFRKFKKFFKKADSVRRPSKGKPQVSDSPPESYLCYNYKKPGHWKSACPYPKVEKYGERERNKKKKKAMVAAENDESSSSSSDEEALVCMERRAEKSNHEDQWTMSEDDTLCHMAKDDAEQEEAAKYPGVWYLESGCSRHMTGDASLLSNLIPYDGPRVTFGGSNDFGLTKGLGNLVYQGLTIQAVSYVEGLNCNLMSISQFCDKGYSLEFCKDMASLKNISTNEVILTGKRIRNIYEVMWDDVKEACLISKDKDEEANEGDSMKPTEFIPFRSLRLKTSQRNPDSDGAELTGNHGQPSIIPDHSNDENSGNGDPVPIHPESPTNSVLQPEAELDQPVNPNQHNLRLLRDHPPQQLYIDGQPKPKENAFDRKFLDSAVDPATAMSRPSFILQAPSVINAMELNVSGKNKFNNLLLGNVCEAGPQEVGAEGKSVQNEILSRIASTDQGGSAGGLAGGSLPGRRSESGSDYQKATAARDPGRRSAGGLAGDRLSARLLTATWNPADSGKIFSGAGGLAGDRRSARLVVFSSL